MYMYNWYEKVGYENLKKKNGAVHVAKRVHRENYIYILKIDIFGLKIKMFMFFSKKKQVNRKVIVCGIGSGERVEGNELRGLAEGNAS